MKLTTMSRRSVLGGLLTAGAVAALPEGIARASSHGALDIESLVASGGPSTPLSTVATPGLHYERFSAISFIPRQTTTYSSVAGGVRHSAAASEIFICGFGPAHGSRLKEIEFYIETGTTAAVVATVRVNSNGTGDIVSNTMVAISPTVQMITVPVDHVVDIVNFDYELWAVFHNTGTFRGARVGSIAPTGLITVPQQRKLDTRTGTRPVVGSITSVNLAPEVPSGARAALVTVTATSTVNGGFVTAFPGDQPTPPNTSTLNWTASNIDIATTTVVDLGAGTSIKLSVGGAAGAATHLLCDVLGYFI
jgi:hypothetical protein